MQALVREAPERPIDRRFGIVFPKPEEIAKLSPADKIVASLLAQESGVASPVKVEQPEDEDDDTPAPPIASIETSAPARALGENDIRVGSTSKGEPVGVDLPKLIDGRLLIQGNSGAGKSMLLRRLFEQGFGRVQQLLIDPDGEFSTLKEHFDVAVLTAADISRVGGNAFAKHLREHRYSAVLDLSDATSEDRLDLVADLAEGLMLVAESHWHPLLVLIDEAQTLAPHYDTGDVTADTRKRSTAMLADLMGRGRKRGIAGVIATQRLAETAKAVVSKATNIVVGRTIFDRDLERAGALLGFTLGHSRALRTLADGEFLAIGPAVAGPRRVRFKAGPVVSRHKGAAPVVMAPPAISAADAAAMLLQVPDAAPSSASPDQRQKGKRGPGWDAREDQIIKAGYTEKLAVRVVVDRLEAAGFRRRSVSGVSTRAHDLGLVSAAFKADWCEEEDQILVDAYAREVKIIDITHLLADAGYDRGRVSVQMRAIALGITRDRVNYWTEPEKAIAIAGLNAGKPYREILQDLRDAGYHRGHTSIFKFASKNNFNRTPDPWTHEDIERLREFYAKKTPVKEIAAALGKPIASVRTRASNLGLKQRTAWTEAEYELLRKASEDGKSLVDTAAEIGRPYVNVARQAAVLKLSFRQNRPISERTPT
ncbi:DUF87 domain-containing protein [Mesorhizobium sp. B2-4-6]|uniref:helicase HerA domain-containing protein n=1 Tax=Mesorhizobium sp. B2-4-6 TaxID=2589943 RepID=UPI001128BC6B|nr:DUF87 domain-containing protein [Mesorhizobium sp. B2-4-6]TPL40671.1 ATP-binding protein [Mesorhizobium sp. B2-4-6]